MYKSKKQIENKSLLTLKKYLEIFLQKNRFIYCKSLKRKVFLDKLPKVIIKRKGCKDRLRCFFVGVDLIQNSKKYSKRYKNKKAEFEIVGFSNEGKKVFAHIREEKDIQKNKRLFLISTFFSYKQKLPPPST
jgi:hypothetical protein